MRVKPIFKTEHQALKEEINKRMDDVKVGIKEIVKQVIEDKDSGIEKNIEDVIEKKLNDGVKVPGSKLSRMIDVIKEKKETVGHEEDIINCPTCHKNHIHKLETDKTGLVYKCAGDKCGFEYVMVPKQADYKCTNCSMPIMKPKEDNIANTYPGCPFCNSKKAIRHDWSKVWNVFNK